MSVACFLLFFGSKTAENQYSRNWTGQKPKSIFYREGHESIRRDGEANQGGQTPLGATRVGPCLGKGVAPLVASRPHLFAYKKPPMQIPLTPDQNSRKPS